MSENEQMLNSAKGEMMFDKNALMPQPMLGPSTLINLEKQNKAGSSSSYPR